MSEERTKDIDEEYQTKPTIEIVLERIDEFWSAVDKRFDALEIRLDRMDSLAHQTRSEMLALRADFRELHGAIKEQFPSVVK